MQTVPEGAPTGWRLFQSVRAVPEPAGCSRVCRQWMDAGCSRVCRRCVQTVQECAGCPRVCRLLVQADLQLFQSMQAVGEGCSRLSRLFQSVQAVGEGCFRACKQLA